jgi:hypothetical protein
LAFNGFNFLTSSILCILSMVWLWVTRLMISSTTENTTASDSPINCKTDSGSSYFLSISCSVITSYLISFESDCAGSVTSPLANLRFKSYIKSRLRDKPDYMGLSQITQLPCLDLSKLEKCFISSTKLTNGFSLDKSTGGLRNILTAKMTYLRNKNCLSLSCN